ncbi:hypothetical protein [Nonomuraea diastatica]|uniref:Uncharacterized protein n=1 Tax=Nonomuraea diastatica TaxID=1848329 RepID=A0A4R4VJU6_9ACTN|nr:hypothetical protein [Nonomuraea diastatica]TDD06009.1 hypothetical protein E1294_49165 [Nonomuraea diastatica]
MAEQAREAAAQARADAAGEADRLRTELADTTSALRTAHQQREEAITAAAVAQALLREQEMSRLPGDAGPGTGHPAHTTDATDATDATESAHLSSDRAPIAAGPMPGDVPPVEHT